MPPSLVGIDGDTQVCAAATLLGLADPSRCPAEADTVTDPTAGDGGSGGTGTTGGSDPTTVDGDVDVCLGLAVLTSTDTTRCAAPASATTGNGGDGTVVGGTESTGTMPALLAETSGGSGNDPGSTGGTGALAFTGADTLLLTFAGLGSVASGLALRRSARARHAG